MVDYESLLKKYISHVTVCEGVDFISYSSIKYDSPDMTDEDIAALYKAAGNEDFEQDRAEYEIDK